MSPPTRTTRNDTFAHNDRSALTAATLGTDAYGYSYDNIGNRKTAEELARETTYDANQLNQYASITENEEAPFVPTYDGDGNQTKIKTKTGIWTVAYNALNRPVRFTRTAEDGTVTTITADYDFMGRRVCKKVETTAADPETGEPVTTVTSHQRYLYRGYLQIAALDLTRSTLNAFWYILWDPTESIATRPLAIQTAGGWFTYGLDLTKNVTELYKSDGTIANAYTYAPFGGVTQTGNITNPLQWSSEVYDAELGMVYYNFRFYNPLDGRWTSRDPIGELDGGANLYTSCKNNSLKNIDLLGNIAWVAILPCLKGAAIGAVSDVVFQKCQCCYKQVGWRIWKCQTKDCPEINVCSVVVSAIVGCAAGYIPGSLIPTSLAALKQLALKTGGKAVAKWIGKLPC